MTDSPRDCGATKDKLAALQSAVVIAAIVIGGIWTAFTFWGLGTFNRSRAALVAAERALAQREVVNVEVAAQSDRDPELPGTFLRGEVVLRNDGVDTTTIRFGTASLLIARREADGSYPIIHRAPLHAAGMRQNTWHLPARSTARLPFFEPIPGAGVYLVQFVAPTPDTTDGDLTYGGRTLTIVR